MFSGLANAANLLNQQRQRNDFVNSDNQLNTIRAEQMELERKARQEALNRSYYGQPAEPTVAQQPANLAEPAQSAINTSGTYQDYLDSFNASIFGPVGRPLSEDAFNQNFGGQPQPPLQFGDPGYMPTYNPSIPASRNPYDRGGISERDRLDMAYRNRISQMGFDQPNYAQQQQKFIEALRRGTPQETPLQRERRLISELAGPAPGQGISGLAALAMGGGNPFMR